MRVVLATRNQKKLSELQTLLVGLDIELQTMDAYPGVPDIVEDADSFEGNALIKARTVWRATSQLVLADDSGIEVDALGGAPGVYSARYAGKDSSDVDNYRKLLRDMAEIPLSSRTARFRCVLALAGPDAKGEYFEKTFDGKWQGRIAFEPRGNHGFGYDPVFLVPEYGMTSAEIDPKIKNRISARANAMDQFIRWVKATLLSPS